RLRQEMQAAGTTGLAEHARPSLRDGLRLIRALLGAPGFLATVSATTLAHCAEDTSIGVSGPHDFAVRNEPFVGTPLQDMLRPVAAIAPRLACRDDRDTPSARGGMGAADNKFR
ncbi:hypothetical protein ACQR1Q_30370, partial [Bradyrhizobium oligotrophicum]